MLMRLNLSEVMRHWGTYYPERLAIGGDTNITYSELNKYGDIFCEVFNERVGGRCNIAILTDRHIPLICSLIGIIRSDNVFVFIHPSLPLEQIKKILSMSGCKAVVFDSKLKHVASKLTETICLQHEDIVQHKESLHKAEDACPDLLDQAGIIFTSGSTGQPKGVVRTHYSILSEAILWIIELQLSRASRFLIARPLYYTGGFVLMYATLFVGGQVILFDNPGLDVILQFVENNEIDWAFFIPSQINELLKMSDIISAKSYRIAKNILTMGSPISADTKVKLGTMFNCNVIESWGNSEGLGTITSSEDLRIRPGSIGRTFFSDKIVVLDENYNILGPNKIGLLAGYSDNVFKEYLSDSDLTNKVLRNNLIVSDDLGYFDDKGYFYIIGRQSDKIIVDGNNVFPSDIEPILRSQKGVLDCVVLGVNDEVHGEAAIGVITKDPSTLLSLDDLLASVNANLAPHQRLQRIVVIESFPRNQGGKVARDKLIDMLNSHRDTR